MPPTPPSAPRLPVRRAPTAPSAGRATTCSWPPRGATTPPSTWASCSASSASQTPPPPSMTTSHTRRDLALISRPLRPRLHLHLTYPATSIPRAARPRRLRAARRRHAGHVRRGLAHHQQPRLRRSRREPPPAAADCSGPRGRRWAGAQARVAARARLGGRAGEQQAPPTSHEAPLLWPSARRGLAVCTLHRRRCTRALRTASTRISHTPTASRSPRSSAARRRARWGRARRHRPRMRRADASAACFST